MSRAHGLILFSYVLAISAAWLSLGFVTQYSPLVQILIADVVATLVIFGFSVVARNASFYDAYWSVAPVVILLYLWSLPDTATLTRQWLVTIVVLLWGVRLTANWLYTWTGLEHVDWRYTNLEAQTGVFWQPINLLGIHLMPTVLVFFGCVPLYYVMVTGTKPLGYLDFIALVAGLLAVWIEFQSDRELHRFRLVRTSRKAVLNSGLWSLCRHPNYLGEIGFWVSLCLFGYAASGTFSILLISGACAMVLLFAVVSIPMIEKKLLADKPEYSIYREASFALLPLSRFKSARPD